VWIEEEEEGFPGVIEVVFRERDILEEVEEAETVERVEGEREGEVGEEEDEEGEEEEKEREEEEETELGESEGRIIVEERYPVELESNGKDKNGRWRFWVWYYGWFW